MSGKTIKLNSTRLLAMRAALKKEESSLQSAAAQVARIASGLDMEVAARANIDASLTKLRKLLKQDAENMSTMQSMADLAMSELTKKDEDLAERADGLKNTMQRFTSLAGAAAAAAGTAETLSGTITENAKVLVPLNLPSQLAADAMEKLSDLFGLSDRGIWDSLTAATGLSDLFDRVSEFGGTADILAEAGNMRTDTGGMLYKDNGFISISDIATTACVVGVPAGVLLAGSCLSGGSGRRDSSGTKASASTSSGSSKSKKKSVLDSLGGAWNKAVDTASGVVDWVGDKASDVVDYVGDKVSDVVDTVEDKVSGVIDTVGDVGKAAMDGLNWLGQRSLEAGEKIWDVGKAVANSKPVEYLWETGGDVLSGVADVGSFMLHVGTGDFKSAALDGYSLINNCFDCGQDLAATFVSTIGVGADLLGADDDLVQRIYDSCDEVAGRDGLAGELHASGLDTLGNALDVLDMGVSAYKIGGGIAKFKTSWGKMDWDTLGDFRDNMLTMSGWKTGDSLQDLTQFEQTLTKYENITSNVKLGYKYLDGLKETLSGGDGGIFEDGGLLGDGGFINTVLGNTSAGKIVSSTGKTVEDWLEFSGRVTENASAPQENVSGSGRHQ